MNRLNFHSNKKNIYKSHKNFDLINQDQLQKH